MNHHSRHAWQAMGASLLLGASSCSLAAEGPLVTIDSGTLQGVRQQSIDTFKGIPFAAPPVGDLRWQAPQPVAAWSGIRPATQYGHDCMQKPFPSDAAPLGTQPAEDCLVLNVWRPAHLKAGAKIPVMVWIYGGGYVNGGASPDVYRGDEFAKDGIVFVSFNYRVGRFGFFAHPALSQEAKDGLKGNYGIMDQIAALEWVKRNIEAFGGDPHQVTLFGESAGGRSVHFLMTSPLSQGLFQRAIIESGGGRTNVLELRPLNHDQPNQPSAESMGLTFAAQYGIHGTGPEALKQLRALSAEQITDGLNMSNMDGPTYAGPIQDDKVLPIDPANDYRAGTGIKVPLMVGANDDDLGFTPPASTMQQALASFGSERFSQAQAAYNPDGTRTPQQVANLVGKDQMMIEPARFTAIAATHQGHPAYLYRFSYVADSMQKYWKAGAVHASEIPYVFNTVKARYGEALSQKDAAMALQMHQYWVNFAKTGNPNGDNLPVWTIYNPQEDNLLEFDAKGAKQTSSRVDPLKTRMDLVSLVSKD